MCVGKAIPCNFDQVVPDIQNTPKDNVSGVRPWPAADTELCKEMALLKDSAYRNSQTIASLHGVFQDKNTCFGR